MNSAFRLDLSVFRPDLSSHVLHLQTCISNCLFNIYRCSHTLHDEHVQYHIINILSNSVLVPVFRDAGSKTGSYCDINYVQSIYWGQKPEEICEEGRKNFQAIMQIWRLWRTGGKRKIRWEKKVSDCSSVLRKFQPGWWRVLSKSHPWQSSTSFRHGTALIPGDWQQAVGNHALLWKSEQCIFMATTVKPWNCTCLLLHTCSEIAPRGVAWASLSEGKVRKRSWYELEHSLP